MSKRTTQRMLSNYVNSATDLAESVKRNIIHEGKIDEETVIKLNKFQIAANAIADLVEELNQKVSKYEH